MAVKHRPSEHPSYTADELCTAIERIEKRELSYHTAESLYGILRSTLHDHIAGKVSSS